MKLSANLVLDTDTDTLYIEIPAAEADGDVVVLSLDLKPLSADDKHRLRHVRDENRDQRPPGSGAVGRPA
jgi:hypothetical protein